MAIRNDKVQRRFSRLADRVRELCVERKRKADREETETQGGNER